MCKYCTTQNEQCQTNLHILCYNSCMNEKLKKLRKEKGLTQKQVAEAIKITASTYANYEQGTREPNIDIIIKLCKFFNTTPNYLLGFEEY